MKTPQMPGSTLSALLCASLAGLVLAACPSVDSPRLPERPEPASPEVAEASLPDWSALLPAGLYFRGYSTCDGCPEPGAAALIGIYESLEEARAAMESVPEGALPLGYPMLAHTDEVGLVNKARGVAVIAGLFRSPEAASDWRSAQEGALARASLEALLDWDGLVARRDEIFADHPTDDLPERFIVRIDAPGPVEAYSLDAIRTHYEEKDWDSEPSGLAPMCTVKTGDVFVGDMDPSKLIHYRWAPITCGGESAVVRWSHTLIGSTVARKPDGTYTLTQVVGAECDAPFFQSWPTTRQGRRFGSEIAAAFKGGCRD